MSFIPIPKLIVKTKDWPRVPKGWHRAQAESQSRHGRLAARMQSKFRSSQKIKANPAKSSAPAMNALMHKMAAIEADEKLV